MAYASQEMKKQLTPGIKAVLKKYKVKGSISIRDHMALVVTLKQGAVDFGVSERDVNTYWIDHNYQGTARNFLNELKTAMQGPDFYNNDDSQTDYFDRSHYITISLGKYNMPYTVAA